MLTRRGLIVASLAVLAAVVFVGVAVRKQHVAGPSPNASDAARGLLDGGACQLSLTRAELETSLTLGTEFLVAHQREAGNFDYLYDWKAKTYAADDSEVRQAGALWGLALIAQFEGPPRAPASLGPALEKGLRFFDGRAGTTKAGGRFPTYSVEGRPRDSGGLGMAALVTLSVIDYVRSLPPDDRSAIDLWTSRANAYVAYLVESRDDQGLWFRKYDYDGGAASGPHSSYYDGEALLALVKAMKYLGRDDLAPIVKKAAAAGHRVNVQQALAADPDSDTTKGYYQWSSMAFYELATSKWSSDAPYGEWLLSLADWMLDVHGVLGRQRNTGYAYEGLIPAYAWAEKTGDARRSAKYACAIHQGLGNLLSWQVGHPRASALGPIDDPKATGGVQNHASEPDLRIDVTQHQMHATILALRHLFR
ncbi:MAG: hypothetical protein J0I07_19810 [Myxococcales bacterium]|nr:hypothetical protein [Myxococcales bacterium]